MCASATRTSANSPGVVAFLAAQWPFATFLVTNPLARGRLFNADNFVYWMSPTYEELTYRFDPPRVGAPPFAVVRATS